MWNYIVSMLLCGIAAWTDIRTKKIPNWLILVGLVDGLILNLFVHPIPLSQHILRGAFVLVILAFGMLHFLGLGDIKFWCVMTVLLGPVKSSLIVAAASMLLVIYAVIRDKGERRKTIATVVNFAQTKNIQSEIREQQGKGYPLAVFMLLPTIVFAIFGLIG